MNRRDFVRSSSLLLALGMLDRSSLRAETPPAAALGAFHPLRRNTGYYTGRGGTIGWLAAPDALAVIDTQFPATAAECLAGLPGRGERVIDVVINTHHHGDHTSGNGVFRPAAKDLVAQENVPVWQRKSAKPGETPVVANVTFADSWRQEIGDEVVTAKYFGAGHTNGDAIIHFERANVVHMGDLVFNRLYPYIDRPAGANIGHWITVLENATTVYPADAIYLCGHGSERFGVQCERDDLLGFRDYLSGLLAHVEREIAAGKSKTEIAALDNLPDFPDFHQPLPNRLGMNLGVAYDELTAVKG